LSARAISSAQHVQHTPLLALIQIRTRLLYTEELADD
jgi:hypothetical protein